MVETDILILVAGRGQRLKPYTDKIPKFLLPINGKTIMDYQFNIYKQFDIRNISLVTGYMHNKFEIFNLDTYYNSSWENTNMIFSIECAKDMLHRDGNLIIIYSDIVFKKNVFEKLLFSEFDDVIIQDKNWKLLWEKRFDNPLHDAETLKLNKIGKKIVEIGKKPNNYSEIEGQYIGMTKLGKKGKIEVLKTLENYIGLNKPFMNNKIIEVCYMTDLLQYLIDKGFVLNYETIEGGWYEVDTLNDYNIFNDTIKKKIINIG